MNIPRWTDQKVETIIGILLQTGVIFSGAIILGGGIFYLLQHGQTPVQYHIFDAQRAAFQGVFPVVKRALRLDSGAMIELGLFLLIATPVSRVIFSIAAFWMQRDRVYVSVTLIVLAILLYSLWSPGL